MHEIGARLAFSRLSISPHVTVPFFPSTPPPIHLHPSPWQEGLSEVILLELPPLTVLARDPTSGKYRKRKRKKEKEREREGMCKQSMSVNNALDLLLFILSFSPLSPSLPLSSLFLLLLLSPVFIASFPSSESLLSYCTHPSKECRRSKLCHRAITPLHPTQTNTRC